MPTQEEILRELANIANDWQWLAIVWHGYLGAIGVALIAGRRPSLRMAGGLLSLPLFSVSLLAWTAGNPFNGTFFAVSGLAAMAASMRRPETRVRPGPRWAVVSGVLLFCFGWTYPHFLETASFLPYLYAAPVGLIPCPTLAAVTGLGLTLGALNSRSWALIIGTTGAFYGLFGALHLGVTIDWGLFVGALLISALGFTTKTEAAPSASSRSAGTVTESWIEGAAGGAGDASSRIDQRRMPNDT